MERDRKRETGTESVKEIKQEPARENKEKVHKRERKRN